MNPAGNPTDDYWSSSTSGELAARDQPATTEYERDRFAYRVALEQMRRQPKMFLVASTVRIGRLWSPLPHQLTATESSSQRWLRYLTASWYLVIYLLALIGLWRLRRVLLRQPWLWGLLLLIALSGVHLLFWSNIRMRAPLMPWITLLAAAACSRGLPTERPHLSPTAGKSPSPKGP